MLVGKSRIVSLEDKFVNFDIVDFPFKTNDGSNKRTNFVIFVAWSALIVGGRVVVV